MCPSLPSPLLAFPGSRTGRLQAVHRGQREPVPQRGDVLAHRQLNVVDILYTAYASLHYEDTLRALTRTHIYKPGEQEESTP